MLTRHKLRLYPPFHKLEVQWPTAEELRGAQAPRLKNGIICERNRRGSRLQMSNNAHFVETMSSPKNRGTHASVPHTIRLALR